MKIKLLKNQQKLNNYQQISLNAKINIKKIFKLLERSSGKYKLTDQMIINKDELNGHWYKLKINLCYVIIKFCIVLNFKIQGKKMFLITHFNKSKN